MVFQGYNILMRAVEIERKVRETEELEDWAEARGATPAKLDEARPQRELSEALSLLPDEVLSALDELIAAEGRGEDLDNLVDPYEIADERGR